MQKYNCSNRRAFRCVLCSTDIKRERFAEVGLAIYIVCCDRTRRLDIELDRKKHDNTVRCVFASTTFEGTCLSSRIPSILARNVANTIELDRFVELSSCRTRRSIELYCWRYVVSRVRYLLANFAFTVLRYDLDQHRYDPYGDQTMQDSVDWMVQRKWITNNPILEVSNHSLSCNTPGTAARAYIPIEAGQNITAVYANWIHTVGPMIAWMAYCDNETNDCHTVDSSTAEWFKIGQQGLLDGTIERGDWFQKRFSRWDGSPSLWSETIPKNLKPGKYFVRHEVISLHVASRPQFYPECAHLHVTGSGNKTPTKEFLARFSGVWSMNSMWPS